MHFQHIDPSSLRRKLGLVFLRYCLLLIAIVLIVPLRAQDEPVHMRPEFPLIFPLAQNGSDVTVKYPVLINPGTVVKPGMVLHVCYVLSVDAQLGGNDLILAHKGNMENSYSRDLPGSGNGPKLPPEIANEIDGYRRTVWQVSNNFILAMAQMPTDEMHLIYSTTGLDKDKDLRDEHFGFFDGLFVGLPNGKVTVIAVEKESKSEAAGIKAGDEIVSVGGIPTQDNLMTYAQAYASAKKAAQENEVSSYAMTIRPGGTGEVRQVSVGMPPSIKSGLMDGFIDTPPQQVSPMNTNAP